jgi:hypothetical protein
LIVRPAAAMMLMSCLLGWMMMESVRTCLRQDLDDLKAAAEASPQPA